MIDDLDESLRAIVVRDAFNGASVDVAFDAPTKDWASRRNAPTVDLYLYDIREKTDRRDVAYLRVRDDNGRVTGRQPPPRRFALSYLITAWTKRAEDEHRLLSAMLSCFLRFEALPKDQLQGALAEQDHPILVTIALPPPEDRSISELWTALGGELKPSLDLVVTVPFDTSRTISAGPPVLEERLLIGPRTGGKRGRPRESPGKPERGRSDRRRPPEDTPSLPAAEETVYGGRAPHRGRTLRVREIPGP
jgi:hypothetical protein